MEKKLQSLDVSLLLDRTQQITEISLKSNSKTVKKFEDYTIQSYFVGEVLRVDIIPAAHIRNYQSL